mmetsp:Transcript_14080/g.38706  ORF Transcript_14080/g.38706 Transcript_14080/m.38706 type:complete len:201 (+) Transcript_14080:1093-1695(+)
MKSQHEKSTQTLFTLQIPKPNQTKPTQGKARHQRSASNNHNHVRILRPASSGSKHRRRQQRLLRLQQCLRTAAAATAAIQQRRQHQCLRIRTAAATSIISAAAAATSLPAMAGAGSGSPVQCAAAKAIPGSCLHEPAATDPAATAADASALLESKHDRGSCRRRRAGGLGQDLQRRRAGLGHAGRSCGLEIRWGQHDSWL